MITIPHTVNLVTEFDETHPTVQHLLNTVENPSEFLAQMFSELLISEGFLDKLNEGNTYAVVKVA
jgi:hypothetical protein